MAPRNLAENPWKPVVGTVCAGNLFRSQGPRRAGPPGIPVAGTRGLKPRCVQPLGRGGAVKTPCKPVRRENPLKKTLQLRTSLNIALENPGTIALASANTGATLPRCVTYSQIRRWLRRRGRSPPGFARATAASFGMQTCSLWRLRLRWKTCPPAGGWLLLQQSTLLLTHCAG